MGADLKTAQKLSVLRDGSEDQLYPRDALRGLSTALAGFSAAFAGAQQERWLMEAGLKATCVDTDRQALDAMRGLYPDNWTFVCDDVYRYAQRRFIEGHTWDLVTLDPPTNEFARCSEWLPLWCALARSLVVMGTGPQQTYTLPEGWKVTALLKRSNFRGGVYWTTLEPR